MDSLFAPYSLKTRALFFSLETLGTDYQVKRRQIKKKGIPNLRYSYTFLISKGKLYALINVVTIREIEVKNGRIVIS